MSLLPYVLDPFAVRRPYHHSQDPLNEIDRLFGTVLDSIQPAFNEAGRLIPANVAGSSLSYSKDGDLTFACETDGFKPDELKVDIQGQTLLVQGRHEEEKDGRAQDHQYSDSDEEADRGAEVEQVQVEVSIHPNSALPLSLSPVPTLPVPVHSALY
ncbi:unnamed protein product [Bursaphelenchus okinawaensis]|uniref:SHSP domain-containing protein n=1 Tax=Bursaphelenchus okinawaensis TaxID=465554 RepID=A0A811KA24_9BILA|nr:unnamed protein product [Bursaphelenchus okinawaensis]CAG9098291.1 unnamed protein product [Bursaphelenchus okinawaensis]